MKTPSVLAGIVLLFAATCVHSQTYILTDLGDASEFASSATGVNSTGIIAGYSVSADGMTSRAWKWSAATGRVDLGGFGGSEARASCLNNAGQITGYATDSSGVAHGFIYSDGSGLTDLGAPPVDGSVYPQAINAAGHIAGYITTSSNNVPFLWLGPNQWLLPGTLPGADAPASAQAMALNDADQIAGGATWIFDGTRAIQSGAGGTNPTALATLGGEIGAAFGINNTGQVVGEAETTNGAQHAFILDEGVVRDLGTLGGADSVAMFIDDVGDVAGSAFTASGAEHAFVWSAGTGMDDLQKFIAPTLGWTLNEAHAINDPGLIAGSGTFNGHTRAFLLTPRSGPDTNPPVVIASLSTNFIGATTFSPLYLTLMAWDDIRVEAKTLTSGSVRVSGPNGFSALASLNSRTPSTNAIQNSATFQINPPGGNWDGADNGAYTVSLEPNSARDIAGNFVPAQTLATFTVAIQTSATAWAYGPAVLLPGDAGNFTFSALSSYPQSASDVFSFAVDWDGDGAVEETS